MHNMQCLRGRGESRKPLLNKCKRMICHARGEGEPLQPLSFARFLCFRKPLQETKKKKNHFKKQRKRKTTSRNKEKEKPLHETKKQKNYLTKQRKKNASRSKKGTLSFACFLCFRKPVHEEKKNKNHFRKQRGDAFFRSP